MRPVATWLRRAAIGALATFIGSLGFVAAQEENMPGAMDQGMTSRGMMERQAMMCRRMDEHIDGDLAYLKTVLKITDAQTQQWNTFAQAFRAERERKARLCKEALDQARETKSAGLIDTMNMAENQLAQRLDSLRAMKAAVQPLYASLDKDQKKTADQIMRGGQIF